MIDREGIRQRWEILGSKLDEREQRLFAANEVRAAGHGALAIVSAITGLARSTNAIRRWYPIFSGWPSR